ncbi:hypothetical protein CEXT_314051 [Caerostris extrusa]|uniref:Uncharacterized protein n=1 Tax=Caerostris extrusa TaxID=172846 RepID=A0AAV4PA78_CAEEX|nr:hypothetical protein CEXT_314051 [Caerostris extrusa]
MTEECALTLGTRAHYLNQTALAFCPVYSGKLFMSRTELDYICEEMIQWAKGYELNMRNAPRSLEMGRRGQANQLLIEPFS